MFVHKLSAGLKRSLIFITAAEIGSFHLLTKKVLGSFETRNKLFHSV